MYEPSSLKGSLENAEFAWEAKEAVEKALDEERRGRTTAEGQLRKAQDDTYPQLPSHKTWIFSGSCRPPALAQADGRAAGRALHFLVHLLFLVF